VEIEAQCSYPILSPKLFNGRISIFWSEWELFEVVVGTLEIDEVL